MANMINEAKVRMEGVEPTCLAALDPKSSASASFATSAFPEKGRAKVGDLTVFFYNLLAIICIL